MSYSSEVLADAPALYWRLGESSGTTAVDSSGNANAGTYAAATLGAAGIPGGGGDTAVTFNGSTSVVTSTFRSAAPVAGGDFTVEAWVNTSSAGSGIRHIAGWRGTSAANYLAYLYVDGNLPRFANFSTTGTATTASGATSIADGNWHHLVGVAYNSGSGVYTVVLYVDGVEVDRTNRIATMRTSVAGDGFAVGADSSNTREFAGVIDEVAHYPAALSSTRITAHNDAGSTAGPAPQRTAALSGSGTLSATARQVAVRSVALAGAGVLSASAFAVVSTTAALSGSGELSPTAYAVGGAVPRTADLTGSGALSATARAVESRSASLSGSGSLSASIAASVSAAFSGSGSLTANAYEAGADPQVSAALSGVGTLAASATYTVLPHVDTNDRLSGRTRDGYAVAEWEPAVVQPPTGAVAQGHRRIRAAAFGELTSVLPPTYSTSEATALRLRTRVVVGGKDISFHGGIPTPEPEYQLAEPLLWGPSSVEIPSIPAAFFDPADYPWLAKGKTVTYQRVTADGTKVGVDYRGVVIAYDISGRNLRLEVGGHGQGRAALRHKPLPIFRDTLDLGRLAWAAVRDLGLRFSPRLGPTTGIRQALFGGMDYLSYISDICGKAFDSDGQWSLMPNESGLYSFARKDRDTVHWTLFNDDARVVADLRSDAAEEPNRVFAGGVTPKGQRVRFGVYPGLKPGPAAPYPFDDDRTFGLGTLDAETDTGDGITVMLRKLWTAGYLSLEEAGGQYDATVTRAVMALQDDAGKPTTGNMNPATWRALFDLDVTGYTLRGSRIEPAAQDYRVRRWNRSASGQVMERNPNFDPSRLIVDREIDCGSGFTRDRMRDWARSEVYRGEDNWFGTVTIHTGGILIGDVAIGATITDADIADVREIRPGQNVRLPMFGGGVLLHISGVEISRGESGHPVARLTVDTQARDALPVWEQIRRNRETRRDAGRRWKGNRASTEVKDSIDVWDEVGGVLYGDRELTAGWNKVTVVGGQEGTVSRLRLVVQTVEPGEEIVINGVEFACAVAGSRISAARMNTLVPNPLSGDGSVWAEKEAALRKAGVLYSAGTNEEPCGYGMGRKSNGATLTGLHVDNAGFSYRCGPDHLLDVLIWVGEDTTLLGGRVMWNQLEAGA